MLIYNRVYDPYHTMIRMLKILFTYNSSTFIEYDRLRIYDFLIANPKEICNLKIRKNKYIESLAKLDNIYDKYNRQSLFNSMESIQRTVIEHLQNINILKKDKHENEFFFNIDNVPKELVDTINSVESIDIKIIETIQDKLHNINLYRKGGLLDKWGHNI